MRTMLDEIIEEADLEMEMPGAGAASNGACTKSFTVDGFGYTVSRLTSEQKLRIKNFASQIFNGSPPLPPLALAEEVRIRGFASGTRRLALHANRRRDNVIQELKKHLSGLHAPPGDIAKITSGNPVTKLVASEAQSDPQFRKVEICLVVSPEEDLKKSVIELVKKKFDGSKENAFKYYDTNADKGLDKTELDVLLKDAGIGMAFRGMYVRGILKKLDTNKDGKIQWNEFERVNK